MARGQRTPRRGEVWLVSFDPQKGEEIKKIRPALVVSDDSIRILKLRIVVPMTSWKPNYHDIPWIVHIEPSARNGLQNESGADAFQVKSVSMKRFVRKMGSVNISTTSEIVAAVALCIGYA